MVEAAKQADFFEAEKKRKLTPEQKKNIQWFWRHWEYSQFPDAVIGHVPELDVEDMDPQAQKAAEWQHYYRGADKYEGKPQYSESDIIAEIELNVMKTVPVGKFYPNLKPIPENSRLILIEDPKSKQQIWYFAEPIKGNLIDLRKFPADYVTEFSSKFPREIKASIIKAQQPESDK